MKGALHARNHLFLSISVLLYYSIFLCLLCITNPLHISNFGSNDRRDFVASSGVLRLSSKYLIEESTRQKALAHIRTAWPSTLKGWDLREDVARAHEVETGQPRGTRYPHPIVSTQCPSFSLSSSVLAPHTSH